VLDPSGVSPALTFLVPNDPLLVGLTFDVQGADIDALGLITLTDNDLEIEVAAPPPASLNMVAIASGTFSMGSWVGPLGFPPYYNQPNSLQRHEVTITRPFWMGKFEVTQAEYQALTGSNPSLFTAPWSPGSLDRPVEQVSWTMAVAYCDALTVQEAAAGRLPSGYEYRLPTEAEWEYCCRAGTTSEFHFGASLVCGQANFAFSNHSNGNCNPPGPMPVGSFPPNAWGLHDMHGNVWEWCLDSWDLSNNYPADPVSDPYVVVGTNQIVRGGAWSDDSSWCRSAFRFGLGPSLSEVNLGFRVVCAPIR
jgi:formylglycine-generating enzyme required for sulfatase activity